MSTTPWRGTLLFAGSLATIAVAAVTRFAGATDAAQTGSASVAGGSSSGAVVAPGGTKAAPGAVGKAPAAAANGAVVIVGSTVQTRYGPVQVSVTFTAKKITAVQALQVPSGHQTSVMINNYAAPILAQEAVAANSAKIDTVSGATFTSQAYKTSLQSAITQLG